MSLRVRTFAIITAAMLCSACGDEPTAPEPSDPTPASPPPTAGPSAAPTPIAFGEWRRAAPMTRQRTGFDAVVLGDGTVLAVGDDQACIPGPAEPGSETAERYDAVGDTWAEVPSLNKPRKEPATVAMADGSAMVLGGLNDVDEPFSSTKSFGTDSGTWTDGPLMVLGRAQPLATTLSDGRVLVVSSTGSDEVQFTGELLDPETGSWTETAAMPRLTWIDAIVGLADGTALAVGRFEGETESSPIALIFDPAEGIWVGVQGLPRFGFELVALPDGRALAIGGADGGELSGGTGGLTTAVHRFEPSRGVWATVAPMSTGRDEPLVAVLGDGRVLVAGGAADGHVALTSTELYDPVTDRWTPGTELGEGRYGGQAVALSDGSVLVLGGANDFNTEGDTPWCPAPLVTTERLDAGP